MKRHTPILAIAAGTSIAVALQSAQFAIMEYAASCCATAEESMPMWHTLMSAPTQAFVVLLPGFIAGWIAREKSILLGFASGFLGSAIYSGLFGTFWNTTFTGGTSEMLEVFGWLLLMSASNGLFAAAAGGTAQLLRSNNSLKSDAAKPRTLG